MTLEVFRDIPADSERLCMLTNYSMAFRQILEDSIMGCGPECSVSRTFRKVPQVREYFVAAKISLQINKSKEKNNRMKDKCGKEKLKGMISVGHVPSGQMPLGGSKLGCE